MSEGTSLGDYSLEEVVRHKLVRFLEDTDGCDIKGFYKVVMRQVEKPLIELVLKKNNQNQLKTASALGINRNTLRKKIGELKIKNHVRR